MSGWQTVGSVVKLQVSRTRIRRGPVFDPGPLREVSRMRVSSEGVIGFDGGAWMLDSHHRAFPDRKPVAPARALLIGFEGNYRRIWEACGQIPLGAAGENVIVSSDRVIGPEEIAGGVRIGRGEEAVELYKAAPAEACAPFTRYVLGQPDLTAEEADPVRRVLSRGLRGYLLAFRPAAPCDVTPGAEVAIRPAG